MDESLFTNVNGRQFAGLVRKGGKSYRKNTKFYVSRYDGFGIQAELVDELEAKNYESIIFVVKSDLEDYRRMNRYGYPTKVCAKGEYKISIEDLKQYGTRDVLNAKHGEQWFICANRCAKLRG